MTSEKFIKFPAGMNEAADSGPSSMPPGTYIAIVTKAEDKLKDGHDQVIIELSADVDGNFKHLCSDVLTFSDKGMGIAAKKLRGLSIDTKRDGFVVGELEGRKARVHLKSEPWVDRNGQTRNGLKVDIYAVGSEAGYERMEQPQLLAGDDSPI